MKRLLFACLFAVACVPAPCGGPAPKPSPDAAVEAESASSAPRILSLPRPKGGEWMGLYMLGQKAGWAFTDLREGELGGKKAVVSDTRVVLKASVGGVSIEREVRDERFYEYKDGGRLLMLRQEKHGDGGEEVLVARFAPDGGELTRSKPGAPDEVRKLPPSAETVENADSPRWIAANRQPLHGVTFDLERFLADKKDVTEIAGEETLTAAGVSVPVLRIKTVEQDSQVPIFTVLAKDGRLLEMQFGEVLIGKAESEQIARQLDKVDIFNLTRVVLDKSLPEGIREVPASIVWSVQGLPKDAKLPGSGRQTLAAGRDGASLLTISSRMPKASAERPIAPGADKELAEALKSTLAVESEAPAIVTAAKKVVGDETSAWAAARKINLFVNQLLEKTYGSSSDRATDVLATRKGDCTEHSLLMTALLRASGIPARRVDGLVYVEAGDKVPALYWHEWVEVYVGEWVQMDPTFNQVVVDPSHIALGNEARPDVAALIGKLKFEPVEVKMAKPNVPAAAGTARLPGR